MATTGLGTINRGMAAVGWLVCITITGGCDWSRTGSSSPDAARSANAPSSATASALGHFENGKRLATEGQFEEAIQQYTEALREAEDKTEPRRTTSSEADVYFYRGLAFLKAGFPDTAAEDFTAVLRLVPKDAAAYERRGYAQYLLGDSYNALRDCTQAIRLDPDEPQAYLTRGEAYADRAKFDRAAADLEQAIALDASLQRDVAPKLATFYQRWSERLADDGEIALAEAKLAEARRWNPALPLASVEPAPSLPATEVTVAKPIVAATNEHFVRGRELQAQQRYDQALIEYTAAIAAETSFAESYLRRGETLLSMGFPDTALEDFATAIRLGGKSAEACRLQAKAFLAYNRPYRASESATDALHFDPSDASTYAIRGEAYLRMEAWDRAESDLAEAIRRDETFKDRLEPMLKLARREHAEATEDEAGDPLVQIGTP